jgi:predicted nucleic acid-binding protein
VLTDVKLLGMDTSPLIYFVEQNPQFYSIVKPLFQRIGDGELTAVASVLSLTEVLSIPYKLERQDLVDAYQAILGNNPNLSIIDVSFEIAHHAARLRATYNLRTPDAIHIATALHRGCTAFLTNDHRLRVVTDLRVVILSDL